MSADGRESMQYHKKNVESLRCRTAKTRYMGAESAPAWRWHGLSIHISDCKTFRRKQTLRNLLSTQKNAEDEQSK